MKRFNPERELYKIKYGKRDKIIFSIMLLLVISLIGTTFALYQVRHSKRIIYTTVDDFRNNKDLILTVLVDGEEKDEFPIKGTGYYFDGIDCDVKGVTEASWNYKKWSLTVNTTKPNKCNILFNKEPSLLTERIKYIIENETEQPIQLIADDTDKNIRYIGTDPKNYIWFNCKSYDNLNSNNAEDEIHSCEKWRIIGLMNNITIVDENEDTDNFTKQNLVKIIKNDSIGTSKMNNINNNDWTQSLLKTNLNEKYIKSDDDGKWISDIINNYKGITNKSLSLIKNVVWDIGASNAWNVTPAVIYNAERSTIGPNSNKNTTKSPGLIGLMYTSDYGYSVDSSVRESCLKTSIYQYNNNLCNNNSWLYNNINEWTLTQYQIVDSNGWYGTGCIASGVGNAWRVDTNWNVRPALYLNESLKITDGNGSIETPYVVIP